MAAGDPTSEQPQWHCALTYAVTGECAERGSQQAPQVRQLSQELAVLFGPAALAEHARSTLHSGGTWPHPVPAELMQGLGYAQFVAALGQLRAELSITDVDLADARAARAQALSPRDRRLLEDVPPHHGS